MQDFPEEEEEDAALDLDLFGDDLLDMGVTSGGDPAAWNIPGLEDDDDDDDDDDVVDDSVPVDEQVKDAVTSGGDASSWGKERGDSQGQDNGNGPGSKKDE